ncbi:uncharacterized protein LDX57_000436 [Aspergillus melleus]|uniref:uncharacterized protein n=1 Tax=Aspergillus melleus TaxID=138277 RepID=UPI001E8E6A01|nr:uncharacterized protein LDX57_000436 [Aspergillus melleus]KAH8422682.1 hypothetical protein LDX57_000436 [Aspergillus melleus]
MICVANLVSLFISTDNPEAAILWRMQLCRLMFNKPGSKHHSAATWSLFEYDENRLAPCRALAEQLMESEPFQWLLADAPFVFNQEWRMISLSRVIDFAAGVIAQVEAAYGGHTVFYRLSELEAAYSQEECDIMGHIKLHEFNGGPDNEANLEGRRLVLIVRPAIATMLSPLRKWLGHDNKTLEFIGPAMVLTGREVPVSERNIEKRDEDTEVGESNVSGSKAEG